jgi:hypothetical protein
VFLAVFCLWALSHRLVAATSSNQNSYQTTDEKYTAILAAVLLGAALMYWNVFRKVDCPFCGNKVRQTAKSCPHCGQDLRKKPGL